MRRALILCNYPPGVAAGQRFRFEQYLGVLRDAGIEATVESFFPPWVWPILYRPGNPLRKAWAVVQGFGRRLALLRRIRQYDSIFIHLEAAPIGPPIIEWALFRLGCRVIYDIDDAIFINRTSEANRIVAPLRWRSKVAYVTRRSWRVTACNRFLVDWARQFNPRVTLLPTTVDPEYHRRRGSAAPNARPVIGWTGSRSTVAYLDIVIPTLARLQEKHDFMFRVICDVAPAYPQISNYEYVPWRKKTEIEDLQAIDIGLMPVPDGLWERGKVGFKAIQYSALAIVPVVSDVGSGPEVVMDGKTGFVVRNDGDEWYRALEWLLENPGRWAAFGVAAREHILTRYSVPSLAKTYVSLFE